MPDFADPLVLLLLPLPLLARWLLPPRRDAGAALSVPDGIGRRLGFGATAGSGTARAWCWAPWALWVLLVVALAGPRTLATIPALQVSGRDLAIALDLSGSMVRDDFILDGAPITRLDAVRRVGADFARRRGGDRVALIVFGSDAYYAAPFTFDTEAVARRIETAEIGISGRATNVSDALGLALKRLAESEAESRVVILLSDGVNNAGATNPRGVAALAAEQGVRVHTIAMGPRDLETAEEGERGVVDAATLRAISEISGGESFRVRTMDDLVAVGEALDRLEATDADGLAAEVWTALWLWPAAAAAMLALALAWREAA
ncbi:Ca-activated chloride channel family protein [Roseivivax marinus]|uniref:VWA domain-containing protein n=1 Tax=Roseivivax marinus TaxID=1379903 RepID=UPI0008AB11E9|nr:VWA domain-containing protein [Roseivivax marinus]SEL71747.1 Ca-activated chloride channel family protein [Roseivivax marinus]